MDNERADRWTVRAIATFSLTLLAGALGVAWWIKNDNAVMMIIGAIVVNSTTVVQFYYGSSRDSQNKSETIAGQLPQGGPQAPAQVSPLVPTVVIPETWQNAGEKK